MLKRNRLVWLLFFTVLCACSRESEEGYTLSFNLKESCNDEVAAFKAAFIQNAEITFPTDSAESTTMDSVVFQKQSNGSFSTEMSIGVFCGIDFELKAEMNGDTLFVDSEEDSDVVTSCSCVAVVVVEFPSEFSDAQILICNGKRKFPKKIVYE